MARVTLLIVALVVACGTAEPAPVPSPADLGVEDVVIDIAPPDVGPLLDQAIEAGPCDDLGDGAPCDDGNACTTGDACQGGFCEPGALLTCDTSSDTACNQTTCDPAKGCVQSLAADGASCEVPCYAQGRCQAGVCTPETATKTACDAPTDPCIDSYDCDPATRTCSLTYFKLACPDGTTCQADAAGKLECLPVFTTLCRPCHQDADCAEPSFPGDVALCLSSGDDGSFCGGDCSARSCPGGYDCVAAPGPGGASVMQCRRPAGASCGCNPAWAPLELSTTCSVTNDVGVCTGTRMCSIVGLTSCDALTPAPEKCDGKDNDCNGEVDDTPDKGCGTPGACCLEPGVCKKLYDQSCALTGGKYQGTAVGCASAACGGPATGACCQPDDVCDDVTVAACVASGGDYRGDGFSCSVSNCLIPVPKGACCFFDGSCDILANVKCNMSGGAYSGDGASCAGAPCPPKGACCLPNTTCLETSEVACKSQSGFWSVTLSCVQAQCTPPAGFGACCLSGGACDVLSESSCALVSGAYLPGESCQGQCDLPETTGACCFQDTSCGLVAKETCTSPAIWKGNGVACSSKLCILPGTGACCIGQSCIPGQTPKNCGDFSGKYAGEATSCDECPK